MDLEVVLLDDHARPDEVEQLGLGDHTLAPLGQREQQVERARAERGRRAVDQQLPLRRPDLEVAETLRHRHRRFHRTTLLLRCLESTA